MQKTDFWILWENPRVGWFERIALKHVHYHMWNRSPVQVRCKKQGTQTGALGWSKGMGWGRRWEGGSGQGGHVYTHGWFMSIYGKNQHNKEGIYRYLFQSMITIICLYRQNISRKTQQETSSNGSLSVGKQEIKEWQRLPFHCTLPL